MYTVGLIGTVASVSLYKLSQKTNKLRWSLLSAVLFLVTIASAPICFWLSTNNLPDGYTEVESYSYFDENGEVVTAEGTYFTNGEKYIECAGAGDVFCIPGGQFAYEEVEIPVGVEIGFSESKNQQIEYTEAPVSEVDNGNTMDSRTFITKFVLCCLGVFPMYFILFTRNIRKTETREDYMVEVTQLAEYESAFEENPGKIELYLQRVSFRLQNRMSCEDKETFKKVEICAQAFDSLNLKSGETIGRIKRIYMPALTDITERIAAAPTQPMVENLMPYFHRHCDVLRKAMEYELSQYQKRATMAAEAEVTAIENFSNLKHDTDDEVPMYVKGDV